MLAVSQDQSKRMADKVGADLSRAFDKTVQADALALRGIALRCATCKQHAACAKLLNENEQLESPPEYCRNAEMFRRLQRVYRVSDT